MLRIRPALPAEPDLIALDTVAYHSEERRRAITKWIEDGLCHIAERDGNAVGYAVVTRDFFHLPFIEMLMVAEPARRAGGGRALVAHCIDLAGSERLFTSTNESNLPTQALLARAGFVRSGLVDNLDEGDPELIFLHWPVPVG